MKDKEREILKLKTELQIIKSKENSSVTVQKTQMDDLIKKQSTLQHELDAKERKIRTLNKENMDKNIRI
jgi:hypothetical protein